MQPLSLRTQRTLDIKSITIDLMSLVLWSFDPPVIRNALLKRLAGQDKALFSAGFLLDISFAKSPEEVDLKAILAIFSQEKIAIVGLCHTDRIFESLAQRFCLAFCQPRSIMAAGKKIDSCATAMVVNKLVRTGQQIYAQNRDLIVLNIVNAGAEVAADGHIHIYAPLRGRALAGANGNKNAHIFVQSMEAELIAIAGIYRTLDQDLPSSMRRKMVKVALEKDRLMMTVLAV